jgi:hypothetical protein
MVKRGTNDSHRDGLVATFLRVVEYYEGIVFLTSNRLEDFDEAYEAFESRLHLRLRFAPLHSDKKQNIYQVALAQVPEIQHWTVEDFQRLANDLDVNGRQIANLVRTALAISSYKKEPLTVETLIRVHKINFGHDQDENC